MLDAGEFVAARRAAITARLATLSSLHGAAVAEEVGVGGLVPRSLTVPPERPTPEEEVVADVMQCRALLVEPVW